MELKDGKGSEIYSVANFELSERDEFYECDKNYLRGLYGAIKDVELETIFCDLAKEYNFRSLA
ncbi:MAG: hypothetical protein LBT59_20435 [Clostridiales bacterium]|jgi:hypothetical protein|nr:hypothetical protein [Clostridiales bacterium]